MITVSRRSHQRLVVLSSSSLQLSTTLLSPHHIFDLVCQKKVFGYMHHLRYLPSSHQNRRVIFRLLSGLPLVSTRHFHHWLIRARNCSRYCLEMIVRMRRPLLSIQMTLRRYDSLSRSSINQSKPASLSLHRLCRMNQCRLFLQVPIHVRRYKRSHRYHPSRLLLRYRQILRS